MSNETQHIPADVQGRILRASILHFEDEETMIAGLRAGAEAVERGELDVDDFVGVWSQYLRQLLRASSVPAPADVRELVAREVFALDAAWRREYWDQFRLDFPRQAQAYYDTADRILGLLRTPRGEGEASGLAECIITCMGCGQDFDANDDAQARYHEAACEVVDHEPARVEIARRLRGAALRSDAQGEDTIPVSALRSEIARLRAHRLLPYLAWARLCALAGGEPVGEDNPAAPRSEAQGEEV